MFCAFGNNPVKYVDPDGRSVKGVLKLISAHREQIIKMANKFNVDPVGIASVIFQEKYHGIFAELKDTVAYIIDHGVNDGTNKNRSYGLAEMRLSLAAEILGKNINDSGVAKEMYILLQNENISIAFIAANIKKNEISLGKRLYGYNAAIVHNMGTKGYVDFFLGKRNISSVAKRSVNYQLAIADALNGVINERKDCER